MLKKELKLIDVFSIASGAMISSGLFILPGLAYYKSGPAIVIAYFLAGILVIPSLLSKAELATAMPKAGGVYFFVDRSLGSGFGTIAGISAWFSLAFKGAFALLGIGAFGVLLFPEISLWQIKIIAVFFCLFFTIINLLGVKQAGKFQVIMVLIMLAIMGFFIVKGLPQVKNVHFNRFMKGDIRTLFTTAGLIFISYGGLTKIASVAEEIENPTRNIPKGMILAFVVVTIIYVTAVFITVGVLGENLLRSAPLKYSLTPLSDAAGIISGNIGKILLSIAAILAFISTANAGILTASRSPMAMSRDGLLPKFLSRVSEKYQTPYPAIIITSLFMIIVILFLDLEMLVKTASTMMILLFGFVNVSVIIMRESGIQNYKPKFKSPFYPWIQVFSIFTYAFIIIEMGAIPLTISAVFVIIGLVWYWFYGRIRTNQESALVSIVRRIKASELRTPSLESELKEIIRERDDIQQDRFDNIIEKCPIVDVAKKINREKLFDLVAEELCSTVGKSCDYIAERLRKREKESSTVLTDNIAIPHIIIEGENLFNIMIVRSREGIFFSEDAPAIQIVFVIAGSKDERTFHLKTLAAIAQIVQNPNFEKRWLNAKSIEQLRDLVLLSDRKRAL